MSCTDNEWMSDASEKKEDARRWNSCITISDDVESRCDWSISWDDVTNQRAAVYWWPSCRQLLRTGLRLQQHQTNQYSHQHQKSSDIALTCRSTGTSQTVWQTDRQTHEQEATCRAWLTIRDTSSTTMNCFANWVASPRLVIHKLLLWLQGPSTHELYV